MKRALRMILRLLASALMLFGGMAVALEYMRYRMQKVEFSLWYTVVGLTLLVSGAALFWKSASLAEKLTDDFEE